MGDIFQEVDEELRQENYAKLWTRYGRYIIAAAGLLILGVAGFKGWEAYDLDRRAGLSDSYAAAFDQLAQDQEAAAQTALAEIADPSDSGYGALAAFARARLLAESGQTAEAVAIWDEIADRTAAGDSFRDIATLLSVMHQMDSGDAAALRARLTPMIDKGGSFRPSALELSALLAVRDGDLELARSQLEEISLDLESPVALRERANQLLSSFED